MLIKALLATRKPLLCALLYGAALFTNGLIFDMALADNWKPIMGTLALSTVAAFGFFWLLKELEDSSLYWVALVLGVALLLLI